MDAVLQIIRSLLDAGVVVKVTVAVQQDVTVEVEVRKDKADVQPHGHGSDE